MMRTVLFGVLTAGTLVLTNCATTSEGPAGVSYADPAAVETTDIYFGSTDLQQIASTMVDSLLTFPPVVQLTAERRPVVFVERIKNKTTEHIDTESVTDTISTKLLQSGKFRFVDMTKVDAVATQLEYQGSSGFVDPATAVAFGRQIGAEFMLYGNFSSIEKRDNRVRDLYYKFTLKLMNLETGIVEWMDEKEIRKQDRRRAIGR